MPTPISTANVGAAVELDVRPISGAIGAEIHGVDVRDLSPAQVAAIRAALLEWKVVFFRDQNVTREEHIEFGRRFGEVTPAHPTLPSAFPDYPEILLLDKESATGRGGPMIESRWHTDVTFIERPPMASILHGVVVPAYGGDTQFTNLARAYETLSPEIRNLVDPLHAVHRNELQIARGEAKPGYAEEFQARALRAVHPVVRVHPESGERVLFVNPTFTSHVCELSRQESAHVLAMLYEHLMSAEFTCRFRWERGSIAFWDNRATCHLVPRDIPEGMPRTMHRITLGGDVPVGPDGTASYAPGQEVRTP